MATKVGRFDVLDWARKARVKRTATTMLIVVGAVSLVAGLAAPKVPLAGGAAVALGAGAAQCALMLLWLPDPDRHSVDRHAWRSITLTLGVTWLTSLAIGATFAAAGISPEKSALVALVLMVVQNIGSLFALQRSSRTRSETAATLRELSGIRVATLSTPVVEEAVNAFHVKTVEELLGCIARMLRLTVSLPLTRDFLDKAVLWVRKETDQTWIIVATSGTSVGDTAFTMSVVDRPTNGAGVIANLAVAEPPDHPGCVLDGDVFLCQARLSSHPWYMPNAASTASGMAAIMLRDESSLAIGALSLTTRKDDLIPPELDHKSREIIDILRFWSHSFVVPVQRLRDLEAEHV